MTTINFIVVLIFTCLGSPVFAGLRHVYEYEPQSSACNYEDMKKPLGDLSGCISRVKQLSASSNEFWFGNNWQNGCGNDPLKNLVECYNPEPMQRFVSLGSRLFNVTTFVSDYLQYLSVFPRVRFRSSPGDYNACGHKHKMEIENVIYAQPDMKPIPAWDVRMPPEITIAEKEYRPDRYYTALIMDPGVGKLIYLVQNLNQHKKKIKVLVKYQGANNYRNKLNPYVVIAILQPKGQSQDIKFDGSKAGIDNFSLQNFLIDNNLQKHFVGLNWINVQSDPYGIQKTKENERLDNCPALIRKRLHHLKSTHRITFLPDNLIDSVQYWMGVKFEVENAMFNVCCEYYQYSDLSLTVDPLGTDAQPAIVTSRPPVITINYAERDSTINYRKLRKVDMNGNKLFTVVLLDITNDQSYLLPVYWLVINIPISKIVHIDADKQYGEDGGQSIIAYRPPLPVDADIRQFMFLFFEQPARINRFTPEKYGASQDLCRDFFSTKCNLDIQKLMAKNRLTPISTSWFYSKKDPFVQFQQVRWSQYEPKVCQIPNLQQVCKEKSERSAKTMNYHAGAQGRSSYLTFSYFIISLPVIQHLLR